MGLYGRNGGSCAECPCAQTGAGEDLLDAIPVEKTDGETVITVTEDSYVYASYGSRMANTITADIGGKRKTFTKCSHVYLLDLGWCKAGTEIKLTCPDVSDLMIQAYKLNFDSLNAAYDTLNAQTMTLDEMSDRCVKGHIDMQTAETGVFHSVRGWLDAVCRRKRDG